MGLAGPKVAPPMVLVKDGGMHKPLNHGVTITSFLEPWLSHVFFVSIWLVACLEETRKVSPLCGGRISIKLFAKGLYGRYFIDSLWPLRQTE